jgi:hypothetical protein
MLDMDTPTYVMYEDEDKGVYSQVPDFVEVSHNTYDCYVGAELELSIGDKVMSGKVKQRKRELDCCRKGTEHPNPILDTRTYEVEFLDGQIPEYSVNVIAENMYTQCNTEGNQYLLLNESTDWRKDDSTAVTCDDMYVYSHNNNQHYQNTTKGWKLCAK